MITGTDAEQYFADRRAAIDAEIAADAEKRIRERFPVRYRNAHADHPDVTAWAEAFKTDPANSPSLLLLGPVGTGKTHQAYGAVRIASTTVIERGTIRRPVFWTATTFADLIADLRPRSGHDSEATLRRYRDTGLLMIDDLGAVKSSEWVEETTYRLINGRYENMRPSIFTTNLSLADLKSSIGDRIASRLAETCVRVVLAGPDRRRDPASRRLAPPLEAEHAFLPVRGQGSGPWWEN